MAKLTMEAGDGAYQLRAWRAARPRSALIVMPGGACRAARYDWLGVLAGKGCSVLIVDAAPGATIPQFLAVLETARRAAPRVFATGHSAGAALILDTLDPGAGRASARNVYPPEFEPPDLLSGVAVMGCSLQPKTLNMVLPHRSESRLLARPGDTPLLFVAGDHDQIAPPVLMARTRQRYAPPTALVVLAGGTHYGFAEGADATDNPAFDQPDGADTAGQRARTVAYLADWMEGRPLTMLGGDTVRVDELGRRGPAILP